jgi:membrane-associated protease RseP (regulator of RpoE activity)
VLNVVPNGPAEKAGILVGDIISHFADQPIESFTLLRQMVTSREPGESVILTVVRQDSELKFTIPIGQQDLIALNELQIEPDTDVKTSQGDSEKLPPSLQIKFETQEIRQRIQALERELRQLRGLQQKH